MKTTSFTIEKTFDACSDGSGAVALQTLSNGLIVRFHFDVKGCTEWNLVQNTAASVTLGRGKNKEMALAEIGRARTHFNTLLARLGSEWLAANAKMYADVRGAV